MGRLQALVQQPLAVELAPVNDHGRITDHHTGQTRSSPRFCGSVATLLGRGGRYTGETRRELRAQPGYLARLPGWGGGATDLLLVSGFVSDLEYAWEYPSLARFLSRLAELSRLILTDRRGSGLSDRFREAPTQETMVRDLEIVLDQVGSAKTTLFGMWDGCSTAVLFAATHPERVSSLILSPHLRHRSLPRTIRGRGTAITGRSGSPASATGGARVLVL